MKTYLFFIAIILSFIALSAHETEDSTKVYPTALGQIGLKLNLIDFLYFKLEFEREFFGVYEEHRKDLHDDEYFDKTSKANNSFGFVIGTYLF